MLEAQVLRAEHRPRDALEAACEALAIVHEVSALHPFYKTAWIEACEAAFDLGDQGKVEELLGELDPLLLSERTPLLVAQEARVRARLAAVRGDRDAAAEYLAQAVNGFRELQHPYPLAMTLVEQAELGVDDPAPLLAEAREILERLGATPWLERVDAAERAVAV
jgi:ATP/maltotriose-dependent transcriptional regulator MalT